MSFSSPDIRTYKVNIDGMLDAVTKFSADSHEGIYIRSLLNITVYTLACRFLEGSVKHIIYNCGIMKKLTPELLEELRSELKKFNNPEFKKIISLFDTLLGYDILVGKGNGTYEERDITLLNELVNNRHKNVHSSEDSRMWYNANVKGLDDFKKEYESLLKILLFLDSIKWDNALQKFIP
jgi:hypothetical protein